MSYLVSTRYDSNEEYLDNEMHRVQWLNPNELNTPMHVQHELELESQEQQQRLQNHGMQQHRGQQQQGGLQHQEVHQEQLQRAQDPFPEPLQEEPESLDHLVGGLSEQEYQELQERHSKLSSLVVGMKARYRLHLENERRRMMIKVPLVVGGVVFGAMGVVWYILRAIKIARTSC